MKGNVLMLIVVQPDPLEVLQMLLVSSQPLGTCNQSTEKQQPVDKQVITLATINPMPCLALAHLNPKP